MKVCAKRFASHREHAQEDRSFYHNLTPTQRLQIWLEICRFDRLNAPEFRLQRVSRVTPLRGR